MMDLCIKMMDFVLKIDEFRKGYRMCAWQQGVNRTGWLPGKMNPNRAFADRIVACLRNVRFSSDF